MMDVRNLLTCYPPDCQPLRIEALGMAGGLSGALFWRVAAPRGQLVLRRWPIDEPSAERLQFIHDMLRHVRGRGIAFVPVPVDALSGKSSVEHAGHLWELGPWMPGAADYERAPSVARLQSAMRALAKFHVAVADALPASERRILAALPDHGVLAHWNAAARRLQRLRELQCSGIAALERTITDEPWRGLAPLAREFVAGLPAAVPRTIRQLEPVAEMKLPLQPCIRDIWHDHVLFSGEDVSGIIDFGAMNIDTPATDVARLLGSLVGDDAEAWQAGLAAYKAVRALSEDEIRAAGALDAAGTILAGCNWIRWIYIDGRQFDNRDQVLGRLSRIVARFRIGAAFTPV
jgi:homoserine kinase type II